MIKLRVIRGFRDLEAGVHRKPGEVFDASEARARVVVAAGVAEVVEALPETATEPPPKRSRKRK